MSEEYASAAALSDAKAVTDRGLFTEREAQAYVLTEVHDWTVPDAADKVGVSESRVYNARRTAREKLESASATFDALEQLRAGDELAPEHCAECEASLQEWVVARGHVLCRECASVGREKPEGDA